MALKLKGLKGSNCLSSPSCEHPPPNEVSQPNRWIVNDIQGVMGLPLLFSPPPSVLHPSTPYRWGLDEGFWLFCSRATHCFLCVLKHFSGFFKAAFFFYAFSLEVPRNKLFQPVWIASPCPAQNCVRLFVLNKDCNWKRKPGCRVAMGLAAGLCSSTKPFSWVHHPPLPHGQWCFQEHYCLL